MTNSPETNPRYKHKGPIRFEAIIPFCIVSAVVYLYFLLFFDLHLRKAMEWGFTVANGAEVNIAKVDTSFWRATFRMEKLQATDPTKPELNRVQIGSVDFKLLWDALLRAKGVIELASVNQIEVQVPRKSPGRVLPPENEGQRQQFLDTLKDKLASSPIGDVAKLLQGFDPMKEIKDLGSLKSAARVQELTADLPKKEKEWNQTLSSLPSNKDFEEMQKKVAGIKVGGNPAELQSQIGTLNEVVTGSQAQVGSVKAKGDTVVGDVQKYEASVAQVDDLMKRDREELESKMKLPKIDSKSLAKQMFGDMVGGRFGEVQKYLLMAKKHMPPKKQVAEKPARGKGKNYEFGRPGTYPAYWLKKAAISSRAENTEFGGNIDGEILDVTSAPAQVGRPMIARIRGDFPKQQIMGVTLNATVDNRKEEMEATIKAAVEQFPVDGLTLSDSDQLKFSMAKAVGGAALEGQVRGEGLAMGMNGAFRNTSFAVATPSKPLETVLKGVTGGLTMVTLGAKLSGTLSNPEISIQSNLADAIENGLAAQLRAQLAEARKKIDGMIQDQVGKSKAELDKQMNAAKGKVLGRVDEAKKKAESIQGEAQSKLNQAKNQLAGAAKPGLDAVKKKLPFGR